MKNLKKKGFTIVELVIVIAVIAVLAAVLIPTFVNLTKKANLSADQVAVRNMNTVLASAEINSDDFGKLVNTLSDNGFNSKKALIPTSKDHVFYWYSTYNKIILVNENNEVVFPEDDELINAYQNDKGTEVLYNLGNGVAASASDLLSAVAKGGEVYFMEDIDLSENLILLTEPIELTINLNGHKLKSSNQFSVIYSNNEDAVINICGEGEILATNVTAYGLWASEGEINVYGGKIYAPGHAAYASSGSINIYGGEFDSTGKTEEGEDLWVINVRGGYPGTISVLGGTFINFDPSNNTAEGAGTNFVAEGYTAIPEEKSNGETWYTVVAE